MASGISISGLAPSVDSGDTACAALTSQAVDTRGLSYSGNELMTTTPEQWRPVVGHEGWYEVSDFGRVRRVKPAKGTVVGRILTPFVHRNGYHYLRLHDNGEIHEYRIHRLVLAAFCGPCPLGYETNHKNGIKSDNRAENLEWVTSSENSLHSWTMGLQASRRGIKLS
jgi:hypothetical protein